MEQPKKNPLSHPLRSETSRRYVPGRIAPRVVSDVQAPAHRARSPKLVEKNQKLSSSTLKKVDVIQPRLTRKPTRPALPRTTKSLVLKRQILDSAEKQRKKARKIYWRHVLNYALVAVVLTSLAVVGWYFKDLIPVHLSIFDRQNESKTVNEVNVNQETNTLDETVPTNEEIIGHVMGTDEPKVLRIPKLALEARIRRVGVSLNNEPISPSNIFDVGWFEASGKPGNQGAVLLNGHIIGPTKSGIFSNIQELIPDDEILIERGDGTVLRYKVAKVQEYLTTGLDMSAATNSVDRARQGLNLVTTVNKYGSRTNEFSRRIIVFAVQ